MSESDESRTDDADQLRRKAERKLARERARAPSDPAPQDESTLSHELDVHRIELEVQNEELRLSQQQLEESRDRYADLYDFAPVGYVTLDGDGAIREINLTAAAMLSAVRTKLVGRRLDTYLALEDRHVFRRHLRDCLADDEKSRTEVHLTAADGQATAVQLDSASIQLPDGSRVCRMAITDISARKRADDEVRALNAALERRVAERTAVAEQRAAQLQALAAELTRSEERERRRLAQILHDRLQQLLYAARLALSPARRDAADEHWLQALSRVDELLEQAMGESRSLSADLCPPVLHAAGLPAALEWLARRCREEHGLSVEVSADSQVEPLSEDMRALLFRAVSELLFNVAKHAKTDRASVTASRISPQQVRIVVEDVGMGFDAEKHASGTPAGFGLMSIRERLELLGGHFELEAVQGKGTRITLLAPSRLPQEPAEVPWGAPSAAATAPGSNAQSAAESAAPDKGAAHIRVMVVDDHEILRDGLGTLLGQQPDIDLVAEAGSGEEAVRLARQTSPDVILMDVTMPGMDGIEATRRITAEQPRVRVIGLSMHEEGDLAASMRRAGAAAYLSKGGSFERLLEAVRSAGQD